VGSVKVLLSIGAIREKRNKAIFSFSLSSMVNTSIKFVSIIVGEKVRIKTCLWDKKVCGMKKGRFTIVKKAVKKINQSA
jgi:uncharacterized membrane protein